MPGEIEKFTFALLIEEPLGNKILTHAQEFATEAAKQGIMPAGYLLGNNLATGADQKALPHVTLAQFHTTKETVLQAMDADYFQHHPELLAEDLLCIGTQAVAIDPPTLSDEPDLSEKVAGNKLYWIDQNIERSTILGLHMYFLALLNDIDPGIKIYNASGRNYRPHITSGRFLAGSDKNFPAMKFPVTTIPSKNLALVCARSTPAGMLLESNIEYIFKNGAWMNYKEYLQKKKMPSPAHKM